MEVSTNSELQPVATDAERLLEKHLQSFLVANIGASLDIPLKLMSTERVVKDVGRIDIMAEGPLGSIWAIELKIGCASRDAVGQLSSYLGALMAEGIEARGILVASDFDAPALAAVRAVPSIYCYAYTVGFSFVAVGERRVDHQEFELSLEPTGGEKPSWPDNFSTPKLDKEESASPLNSAAAWPFCTGN